MYFSISDLVDFFNSWSRSGSRGTTCSGATGHATRHTAGHTSCTTSSLVQLGDDWVADGLNLLLLIFEFIDLGSLVGIKPGNGLITFVHDGLLVAFFNLVFQFFILNSGLHVETIRFQTILS